MEAATATENTKRTPTKAEKYRELNKQRKKILAEQKKIREELDASKEERKEARSIQAECRRNIQREKASLRDLTASVYKELSDGDSESIGALADNITDAASDLASTIRKFSDAQEQLELL